MLTSCACLNFLPRHVAILTCSKYDFYYGSGASSKETENLNELYFYSEFLLPWFPPKHFCYFNLTCSKYSFYGSGASSKGRIFSKNEFYFIVSFYFLGELRVEEVYAITGETL